MTDIRNFRSIDRRKIAETREPLPDGSFDFKFTRTTEWKQLLCEQLGLFSQKGSVVANQSIAINVGRLSSDETFELLKKVESRIPLDLEHIPLPRLIRKPKRR